MSQAVLVAHSDTELSLQGCIDYQNVPGLAPQLAQYLNAKRPLLSLDLSAVTLINSAGMALLIEWLRQAQKKEVKLEFRNIPKQLAQMAALSRVDKIINLSLG